MRLVQNMSGFSIYYGSKYSRFTLGSEYAWTCLIMSEWLFVLHLPIVIPFLKEPKTVSLKSKNVFFCIYQSQVFFVLDWIFVQVRFQICRYLSGLRGPGAVNLNILKQWCTQLIYLWSFFNYLFTILLLLFFHFFVLQRT